MDLETFLELSRFVTDQKTLDADIAAQYYARLVALPTGAQMGQLLAAWQALPSSPNPTRADFDAAIMANSGLSDLVVDIVTLWYCSALPTATGTWVYGTPEAYFTSLVWPVIGAHVPGLSGGYHGHWHYPPDNG